MPNGFQYGISVQKLWRFAGTPAKTRVSVAGVWAWVPISASVMLMVLGGCSHAGSPGGGGGSGGGGGNYTYLSGNWEIQTTPTSQPTPFTALAGFINEQGQDPGVDDLTTAAFQATPGECYMDAVVLPMKGATLSSGLLLQSFSVNGQVLTINAKKDSTATHLSGTYSISGGCADGAAGTIAGTEYQNIKGSYSGSVTGKSPAETLTLNLAQYEQGSGDGAFLVSGTAKFSGIACFSSGTLASQNGSVVGSAVALMFSTNDPAGAQLTLTGTIDQAADTLTLNSIEVSGGSCPGTIGTATLTLQN